MSDWKESTGYDAEDPDVEEVEILEVVGVDREAAPPAPGAENGSDEDGPTEVVLLDGDEATVAGEPGESDHIEAAEQRESAVPRVEDDPLLRLRADYDNLRRRIDRERQEFELYANSQLVARLLPILDNFERALTVGSKSAGDRAFREGCIMIYKQLTDELRRQGLQPIDAAGQLFDPEIHDAVATDVASDEPWNTVVEELRRGYLFRNRMLRPALVKVSMNGGGSADSE